jgi:pyridoxal phosphate enzyme (YggS family)
MTTGIQARVENVRERIRAAAEANGRRASAIRLIAVSKTFPAQAIVAAAAAGVMDIGENYIQEAREKHELLKQLPVKWHFIGHLQTNKVRYAVRMFDLIHTVDSYRLAAEIDRCARLIDRVQPVLVQVNIAGEATKSGVPPEKALPLVQEIATLENVRVKGLMTMPPYFNDPERVRPHFAELRRIGDRIRESGLPNVRMDELSMGMTGDFEAAIAEGATLLRIGTAIFGERS